MFGLSQYTDNYIFWIIIFLIIVAIFWMIWGGRNHEFVGIRTSHVNVVPAQVNLPVCYVNISEGIPIEGIPDVPGGPERKVSPVIEYSQESAGEKACRSALHQIYPGYIFSRERPSWLINPKTGRRLELDCYNEELAIAVEYNGSQHRHYPNGFHRSYEEFQNQIDRDEVKVRTTRERGVHLISVPHSIPLPQIKSYILERLYR